MMREYSILDMMPFGKYREELVGTVIEEDRDYIYWAINNTDFRIDAHGEKYLKLLEEEDNDHTKGNRSVERL
jgi:hypothetical protein